jgi:hypothetical protein
VTRWEWIRFCSIILCTIIIAVGLVNEIRKAVNPPPPPPVVTIPDTIRVHVLDVGELYVNSRRVNILGYKTAQSDTMPYVVIKAIGRTKR